MSIHQGFSFNSIIPILSFTLMTMTMMMILIPSSCGGFSSVSPQLSSSSSCPSECICKPADNSQLDVDEIYSVSCSGRNLTTLPLEIPTSTRILELERNSIDEIDSNAFLLLGSLKFLKELTLSRNQLIYVPHALPPQIQILNLAYNRINRLNNHILGNSSKLHALILSHNIIEDIDDEAFNGLSDLYILELNDNRLTQIPSALAKLKNLHELNLANNRIVEISIPFHQILPKVVLLEIKGNPLKWMNPDAFTHLRHLKKLILSDVKNLTDFPHLNGTTALEILRIDRCALHSIPQRLCYFTPKLKSLDVKSNNINKFPTFEACSELKILDVGSNEIEELEERGFQELSQLHDLHLSHNLINRIPAGAFQGLSQLRTLDLSYNNIGEIHPEAFLPTSQLEDLNLGNNYFPTLPSDGWSSMTHLKVANNPNLREFPGPAAFPRVRTLVLSYAYHCCQFTSYGLAKSSAIEPPLQESIFYPTDKEFDSALSDLNLASELWPGLDNFSDHGGVSNQDFWKVFGSAFSTDPSLVDDDQNVFANRDMLRRDIQCIPLPGPFLPCNDLFDWWTLRCSIWVVFLLALMGNGTVVFVLIFARTKMDVPRFLVCNLAIADFFMGVYLGFLAVVDAATLGEFRRFAIPWQLSKGCQMAGFLGVLSSELSVYTLAVITMERHYAITHAMHLNKRLSLRHATYIMIIGWIFALVMAILPLFGVSDYRKFAVCLPFETGDTKSMSYVVFLMFANGVAFTILMGCYLKMYCSIRGSQAWNSNDTRIAKRMALLVFTDLLCWFPIAFFSLTAVFGLQLVSLEEAKVFTVFILPLNSCCNPFLYAILTKQFKKDCVLICKAIEESRVTRGIGRCRHSSNFSNRQTAANTGSLVEKSSKDGQPCICHSGFGGDENGNAKYRFISASEKWSRYGPIGRFFSRYILCHNDSKEANRKARDDYRMRNVRRFLYNATPGGYAPDTQKHNRHASVSSDNFSSSRSDSWRVQKGRCGIPLRLLEKPRRRNSWAVTRKPSQDSNLSSSRNDSSATSNSTATWRLSRSSVSSDVQSHSGGGKSSLKRTLANAAAASTHNYGNISRGIAVNSTTTTSGGTIPPPILPVVASSPSSSSSPPLSSTSAVAAVAAAAASSGIPATTMMPNIKSVKILNENIVQLQPTQSSVQPHQQQLQSQSNQQEVEEPLLDFNSSASASSSSNTSRFILKPSQKKAASGMSMRMGVNIPSTKKVVITTNKNNPKSQSIKNNKSNKKDEIVEDDDDGVIEDDELSAKIATNRPRLVRQSAFFSEEVVIQPEMCPVHGQLIRGTYDNEEESDIDELNEEEEDEDEECDERMMMDPTSPILRKPNSNNNPYSIALVLVPRRLSTISSSRESNIIPSIDEDGNSRQQQEQQRISAEHSGSGSSSHHGNAGIGNLAVAAAAIASSSTSPSSSSSLNPNNDYIAQQHQHQQLQQQSQRQHIQLPVELMNVLGRRKMSEQPVKLYILPPSVHNVNRPKWHSMTDVVEEQTQPQLHVPHPPTSSQSPVNNPEENITGAEMTVTAQDDSNSSTAAGAGASTNESFKDERRVSFQLPEIAIDSSANKSSQQQQQQQQQNQPPSSSSPSSSSTS